jgi:hypothetical protein
MKINPSLIELASDIITELKEKISKEIRIDNIILPNLSPEEQTAREIQAKFISFQNTQRSFNRSEKRN